MPIFLKSDIDAFLMLNHHTISIYGREAQQDGIITKNDLAE